MSKPAVNWLVEDGPFDENLDSLVREIKSQGMRVEVVKYKPFGSGTYDMFDKDACVLVYGSLNLAQQIQREKAWVPGPICTLPNLKFSSYAARWGKHLLNQEYVMLPYGELDRRRVELCDLWGHLRPKDSYLFVRPDDGSKSFTGQCVSDRDFKDGKGPFDHLVRPETMIIAASPLTIMEEYRFVIAKGKVVTGSKYKFCDKIEFAPFSEIPAEAVKKANQIATEGWSPDPIYCMDICFWRHEHYLLEVNSFSCSGLYQCDMAKVVSAASEVAQEEWLEVH